MALLNLSLVTQTFIKLLDERLPLYPDWPSGVPAVGTRAAPPDAVAASSHGLSFYLYHVREDAHTKAQDWQVDADRPLRFKSMGVSLFYVLCPRSDATDLSARALAEQLVMGLALKTLHDYPMIDDTTLVDSLGGPTLVMPATMRGRGNRLRVTLMPKPPEDAPDFWQSGTLPTRLAAYYEVAATLLEPDEIRRRAGRVLTVGAHTFVRGRPYIEGTRNTLTFTIPGELLPREVTPSPAEVPFGDDFEVFGADLSGDRTELLLDHRDFVAPVPVDPAWNVRTTGSVLTATARAAAGAQAVLPGIYGVFVRTVARRQLPDGGWRDFENYSNQGTIAIAPRILGVAFAAGVGTIQVDGFEPHLLASDDLLVFAGVARLTRTNVDPPPAGEFFTPAAPPPQIDRIRFRMPAGTPAGALVPIRLIVRHAESAPRWEVAP